MEKPAPTFEHVVCTRCGGSGKFSYNLMHGDRCYGCGGSGYKLTKRGQAAQNYLNGLRNRPASEIKVGDTILYEDFIANKSAFVRVVSINEDQYNPNQGRIVFNTIGKNGKAYVINSFENSLIRVGFSAEQKAAQVKEALAYQDTLTKAGFRMLASGRSESFRNRLTEVLK